MDKRRALPRSIKLILLLVQHLTVAAAACCIIIIFTNTGIKDTSTGEERHYGSIPFIDAESFEDTQGLFLDIFKDHLKDVVTKVVIGSQLGEDGTYNGKSVVDIRSYANRKDLYFEQDGITAYYRLGDLLKWYNSGMEYDTVIFKGTKELDAYFGEQTFSTTGAVSTNAEMQRVSALLSEYGISHNVDIQEGQIYIEVYMIKDKYFSAENIPLALYAYNWESYGILSNSLATAVEDLGYNFSLYNSVKDAVLKENTNLRYYFEVLDETGKRTVYTNDEEIHSDPDAYFRSLGKYAMYDTGDLSFETDILNFHDTDFRRRLERYEYVFGENSKLYIGVDTDYPVDDIYRQAKDNYEVLKHVWVYVAVIVVAMFIWLVLLIYLSVMTGRIRGKDGIVTLEPSWFDYIPTEIATILGVFLGYAAVGVGAGLLRYAERIDFLYWIVYENEDSLMRNITAFASIVVSMIFTQFWYSLIRRLKMHTLWKNSLCGRLVHCFYVGIRKIVAKINENLGTVARLTMYFCFLLLVNLGLGSVSFYWLQLYFSGYGWGEYLLAGLLVLALVLIIDCLFGWYVLKSSLCRKKIVEGIVRIREGEMDYQLDMRGMYGENQQLAEAVNSIGTSIKKAVETSMKDERLKADLITNVSHDIKTPLTSIINYVDLLKRENIQTEPVRKYIEVLDSKSQRLKQLTDDLVEASKISSGNIVLNMENIDLAELLKQAVGEFSEKFEQRGLTVVENYGAGPQIIWADSRRMWRVVENLFNNIYKYAMEGTRIYIETVHNQFGERRQILLSIKNISANPLNIRPEELTERFIRGDESRATEGSGLGLSIAKSLTEVQGGKLNIVLDGDLFKVVLVFEQENV
ncbi:MAG: HAMP domain-containing histidine kinase [Lachnospiraceae bacterium]|nr:HAMP domain-containing histidine kinase [Lachnospiraceae bacterium]